ncbi:MAG TPA: DNA methyltransferase, partial [Methylotenera sp.]|nr:DNA methyltransferase [Methylotenera sp.]
NAGWDDEMLKNELESLKAMDFDLSLAGFDEDELKKLDISGVENEELTAKNCSGSLAARFMIPPFSVLNAREGWWQNRKKAWLALGIKSEEGRDNDLLKSMNSLAVKSTLGAQKDNSIFDPVLCELVYRWFSPNGATVLDPFAGGSVRGVVAGRLGRQYIGCELRQEQVDANRKQAATICKDIVPVWHCTDSININKTCDGVEADLVFSCPPYADLEVYSDNPQDLSTMKYADFKKAYFEIIAKSCALLKHDRFACFVVGEVRDKKGNYYNFVGDTIEAFKVAGLEYYNEAVLLTQVSAKALTAAKSMSCSRKLGKTHQNVLVFVKGDGKKAAQACGTIEVDESMFEGIEI